MRNVVFISLLVLVVTIFFSCQKHEPTPIPPFTPAVDNSVASAYTTNAFMQTFNVVLLETLRQTAAFRAPQSFDASPYCQPLITYIPGGQGQDNVYQVDFGTDCQIAPDLIVSGMLQLSSAATDPSMTGIQSALNFSTLYINDYAITLQRSASNPQAEIVLQEITEQQQALVENVYSVSFEDGITFSVTPAQDSNYTIFAPFVYGYAALEIKTNDPIDFSNPAFDLWEELQQTTYFISVLDGITSNVDVSAPFWTATTYQFGSNELLSSTAFSTDDNELEISPLCGHILSGHLIERKADGCFERTKTFDFGYTDPNSATPCDDGYVMVCECVNCINTDSTPFCLFCNCSDPSYCEPKLYFRN